MDGELLGLLAGILVGFVGVVGGLLWVARPRTGPVSALDRALARAAEAYPGLVPTWGTGLQSGTLSGAVDGVSVSVHHRMHAEQRHRIRGGLDLQHIPELRLGARGPLGGASVSVGAWLEGGPPAGERLRTGDPAFDDAVDVRAGDPLGTLACLDAGLRKALADAAGWRLAHGSWSHDLDAEPFEEDVVLLLQAGLPLAQRTDPASRDAALQALVDDDPLPTVRLTVLEARLRHGAPPRAALRRWAGGSGRVALAAARALVAEGHAFLAALLEAPDVAGEAALTLCHRDVDAAEASRCEEVLLHLLASDPTQEVVEALGRIGSARAVPSLRAPAGRGLGPSFVGAMARIQERLGGRALAGGLSIAAAEGGQLSVARPPAVKES